MERIYILGVNVTAFEGYFLEIVINFFFALL